MFPRTTLVTGASRPLGIELVRQCLERGDQVIAASRNPARVPMFADLRAKYGTLELLALDPADAASVAEAIPILENITRTIDLLIVAPAEAGGHEKSGDSERDAQLDTLSATALVEHYRRYAVAPVLMARTLVPWLSVAESPRILLVSSGLGLLAEKTQGGDYAVCASAAALHMLGRAFAHDVANQKIIVCIGNAGKFAVSPNSNSMSGSIEATSSGLLNAVDELSTENTGAFVNWAANERA